MSGIVRCHGVLITFRRRDALVEHLRILADQTSPLATLLVVDNDDDPAIRTLVEDPDGPAAAAASTIGYLGLADNPGPAGGIAAGIAQVLADHGDDDWLVLLDDDDPPPRPDTFAALQSVLLALRRHHDRVGGVGLWGATLRRSGRLRAATGTAPEEVAYLPGGACPHYSVAALRVSGGPDPALFFGFDDLDLGLALRRARWSLWSSGIAREHGWAAMVDDRTTSATVTSPTWRRYYSLRNLIVVLRRDHRGVGAVTMSVVAGVAKPIVNFPRRPRVAWANLRLNLRAVRDGWTGRLGKTLDPRAAP